MNDPTYTFIRGQGWLPVTFIEHYTNDRHGKGVRLIERTPNPGEHWIYKTPRGVDSALEYFTQYTFEQTPTRFPPGDLYDEYFVLELLE